MAPIRIRPKSGPEAQFPARKHYNIGYLTARQAGCKRCLVGVMGWRPYASNKVAQLGLVVATSPQFKTVSVTSSGEVLAKAVVIQARATLKKLDGLT